ncbi:transcription termination/antitermination NusG family protein [Rhodoferax sp.]|uniref:transcription termination/antitermination NusG family protein n=1 Tax=Rhodoferax sp. TaxID=50421 RepID=UPI002616A02C|nr:transcription termination/antitermination NusG family protein [Rhodoferax sp.]MDD3936015.1 transcription termination/antitermination NusG family protein [Rhodoferax sp.]
MSSTALTSPALVCGAADSAWYLAYTKPRQEQVAHHNLQQQGFNAYLPLYKKFKNAAPDAALNDLAAFEPMFARYIFFQPANPSQSISTVRSTRGVSSIVTFGHQPALVQPATLHAIQRFEQERNQAGISTISPFQPGVLVRMRDEALQGLQGLVQAVSAKRVTLLLDILGRQKLLQVDHSQLELA